jgi:cell division protein FtsQ
MTAHSSAKKDCPRKYRIAARSFGVLFLASAVLSGVIGGGHLHYEGSPWLKLPGQVAGMVGLAALDIKMTGLQHHEAADVLQAIDVRPGGPLLGFDAKQARDVLETLDWVETAAVTRSFPNQLHIEVVEREPFVVWQLNSKMYVVDRKGKPMGEVTRATSNLLLHVVGERANEAAGDLVNQMEATPELFQDVKAATFIGGRRWNLLMKNSITIALPELEQAAALRTAQLHYFSAPLQSGKVNMLDLRISGEVAYHAATQVAAPAADPRMTSSIQ